jgi:hypothetical protein
MDNKRGLNALFDQAISKDPAAELVEMKNADPLTQASIKPAPRPVEMLTPGERKVRIDFNVSGYATVDLFKRKTADLINDLDAMKNEEVAKHYGKSEEGMQHYSGEKFALIAKAIDAYELAAMYAVKAATC